MKSFSEWVLDQRLSEEVAPGNYVSMDAPHMPDTKYSRNGINVAPPDTHVTLMYSKNSSVPLEKVKELMKPYENRDIICQPKGLVKFNDSRDDVVAIVLKLHSDELQEAHEMLSRSDMEHSYDPFEAHVTLAYKVPLSEADEVMNSLKDHEFPPVVLRGVNVSPVIKDWAETIKK